MEIADRDPHARHMLTAPEARGILLMLERDVKSQAERCRKAGFFARNIAGRLSPEAIEVYSHYAKTGDIK